MVYPPFNETSVHGVFAAGDAASQFHAVSNAIYGGSVASAGLIAQLQADQARPQAEQLKPRAEEAQSRGDQPEVNAERPEVRAEDSRVQVELQAE